MKFKVKRLISMPRCLERVCGVQVVERKTRCNRLRRALRRGLHLRSLAKGMILGNLKGADHRVSKSLKWRSQKRAMIELIYQINLRFKHKAMDRDTKNVMSSRDMARADHQGM